MNKERDYEGIRRNWSDCTIEKELGAGAYGRVYEVQRDHLGLKTSSAIKVIHIPPDPSYRRELVNMGMTDTSIKDYYYTKAKKFLAENTMMEQLKSAANVVIIEDCVLEKDGYGDGYTIYIKMELLETFTSYIRSNQFRMEEIAKVGMDICDALIACEQFNIIHRDIKPANVFRNSFGNYKLGDFGVARELESATMNMTRIGTSNYMAPELHLGGKADKRVDIYSLGIMLYSLANYGCFPFVDPAKVSPEENQRALALRFVAEEIPLPGNVDPELGRIIVKACANNPEDRYQDAAEFRSELDYWWHKNKHKSRIVNVDEIIEKETQILKLQQEIERQKRLMEEQRKEIERAKKRRKKKITAEVGETITFGSFNGRPISWLVLDGNDEEVCLLSQYILTKGKYNDKTEETDWEHCSLRSWLNTEFISACFTDEEQEAMQSKPVANIANPEFGTAAGNVTMDKVSLLSIQEVEQYFQGNAARVATAIDGASGWWCLRSPGKTNQHAASVSFDGTIYPLGNAVGNRFGGIRPMMWIDRY